LQATPVETERVRVIERRLVSFQC